MGTAVSVIFSLLVLFASGSQLEAQAEGQTGEAAILSLGGKLYDNHWVMLNRQPPPNRHPQFPKKMNIATAATWRCVSCHGWDYRGADGHVGKVSKDPVFKNLSGVVGLDPQRITDRLVSQTHHSITAPMSPEQLLALAKFLSLGQHDMDDLVSTSGKFTGDPLHGKDIFEGTCRQCHGVDGKAPIYGEEGDKASLGWLARNRAEQVVHKIRNGVPSADMLALRFVDMASLSGLIAYLQTLDAGQ